MQKKLAKKVLTSRNDVYFSLKKSLKIVNRPYLATAGWDNTRFHALECVPLVCLLRLVQPEARSASPHCMSGMKFSFTQVHTPYTERARKQTGLPGRQ